ncbi:alpha-galactosidase [Agromyces atrinae]|uniref:Alpha-galactosidase n=2 Tax=Agromyces atrinae TaxID=592376 RepID=A0A852SJ81_9MICO|nr:alpha-galactosidase [Agromyces atrinae]NYD68615.1 alpha-galactosidase [Agromyces atrinae]
MHSPSTVASTIGGPTMSSALHLRDGGTSIVLDLRTDSVPTIVYWGDDLGDISAAAVDGLALAAVPQRVSGGLDVTARLTLLPQPSSGWLGTPAIQGHRMGRGFSPRLALTDVSVDGASVTVSAADERRSLSAVIELEVTPAGLLRQRLSLTNTGDDDYTLDSALMFFPVPADADEILDTTGRHLRERSPQRQAFTIGSHVRESRRGRPGADSTLLHAAGRRGFGFESGLVHGVHLAWSGNHRLVAERTPTADGFLAAGELFEPGEVILAPGQTYRSPDALGSWGEGLSALSARFHDELRARPSHVARPRPITLNTWEAVYFDHDVERLLALADAAASVGVERFVLDDGWFLGRRDDEAGLGDWYVDRSVWPDGLTPLVDRVIDLGMEFGLWVEPEMVNPDSDLARAHPDWLLSAREDLPLSARQQQVLDLANPEASAYVLERLDALVTENRVAYLKWDHNRDLLEPGDGPSGRARSRENVLALYDILDTLRLRHPHLEIESCASGGARVDLGILQRTDRIWTSDCLDPLERLQIQKYTGLVVPPEMMGAHFSSPVVHSTDRTARLELSAGIALIGHVGIEWDLTSLDEFGLAAVARWVRLAKHYRDLVRTGSVVHADRSDDAIDVRGVVSHDREHAFFTITQARTSVTLPPGRIRLPGLDPTTEYTVSVVEPSPEHHQPGQSPLAWATGLSASGRSLGTAGLQAPVQFPGRLTLIDVHATA